MWDYTIQIMSQCTHYKDSWNIGGYNQWDLFSERAYPKCDCSSYKYSKGSAWNKTCKHLKQVEEEMCTWHELTGETQVKEGVCPRCGRQTEFVEVAV